MANRPTEVAQELTSITGLFWEGWEWVGRRGVLMLGTELALEKDNVAVVKQTGKHANTAG